MNENGPWEEFRRFARAVLSPPSPLSEPPRCGDLYCGESGFGLAARNLGLEVVYAFEPDAAARCAYTAKFGLEPQAGIVGDRLTNDDVPPINLLFTRTPQDTAEFDRVVLGFLRLRRPVGVILGGAGELDEVEEVVEHVQRRMGQEGYTVSYRSLEAHPYQYPGGYRHLIVAGTSRRAPFSWNEVVALATRYDFLVAQETQGTAMGQPDADTVSLPVAQAVIETMAGFVRETAGTTSKPEGPAGASLLRLS